MAERYSIETLRQAVSESLSIAQTLKKLGLRPVGGNYAIFKRKVSLLGIDTSHFRGKGHLKGRTHKWASRTPLEQLLVANCLSGVSSAKLKARLLSQGLLQPRCHRCKLERWMDAPIPLELEHVNGDRRDNRLENLALLCPNCHALTPTYRGRNKRRK